MFQIGLNPYGFSHAVGLQAFGTPRANPGGSGLRGFISIADDIGAGCYEFDGRWLAPLTNDELAALGAELPDVPRLCSYWLQHVPGETLDEAIRATRAIGGKTIRMHLTPVLEGARAKQGPKWHQMIRHARETLNREARKAADAGLQIAIENHQDFGSDELMAFVEEAGPNAGIAMDTGNAFAVAEDPVAFAARVAPRIKHVHLKDYVSQFTPEGFRLIRCAIGDGCVPLKEITEVFEDFRLKAEATKTTLTASIEVGALEARHIRVFAPDWWEGYPTRPVGELRIALDRLKTKRLDDNADYRTPWELNQSTSAIVDYELEQLRKSVANLRALGWMSGHGQTRKNTDQETRTSVSERASRAAWGNGGPTSERVRGFGGRKSPDEVQMDREFSLKGEVALVTGSGRGLGHAIAVRLAELGADVALHDYDEKAPAEFHEFADLHAALAPVARHGTRTHAVVGDIGDEAAVKRIARDVESTLGPVTILVNSAGGDIGAGGGKPNPNNALQVKLEDVRALLNRNLVGTMLMCQAIVCGMVDRKNGAVVNIASTAGHFGTSPEVAYSTIKAAIVHYTRCLAYETRKHHVRVNCVSPGATATARFLATRKIDAAMLKEEGTFERYGVPRDQANAVAFLCTPAARYIHGQVLRVDGGLTLYAG